MKKLLIALSSVLVLASAAFALETPLFPGAKELPANDPMSLGIEMTKKQLQESAGSNAKVEAYVLPAGTTFDKVTSFYGSNLKGYTEASKTSTPTGGTATWQNQGKSTISLTLMNNTMQPNGAPYLVVAEAKSPTSTH